MRIKRDLTRRQPKQPIPRTDDEPRTGRDVPPIRREGVHVAPREISDTGEGGHLVDLALNRENRTHGHTMIPKSARS